MKREKGFSLIEVLIVLLIIFILTTTAFPVLRRQVASARAERILTDLEVISEAGAAYYRATGSAPVSLNSLVSNGFLGNVSVNPYGNPYLLQTAAADRITVRTTVPAGLIPGRMDGRLRVTSAGGADTVEFSQPVGYSLPGETHEKRYLYGE